MGRYVDIDKVKWNKHYLAISNGTVVRETLQVDADYLNTLVEDVAPNVHAHWITTKLSTKWTFRCSNCNSFSYESTEGSDIQWKYCPDCRATMDEEVNDG